MPWLTGQCPTQSLAGSASGDIKLYDPANPGIRGPAWGEYGQGTVLGLNPDLPNLPPTIELLPKILIFNGRSLCERDRIKVVILAACINGLIPTGVLRFIGHRAYYKKLQMRETRQRTARGRPSGRFTKTRFGYHGARENVFKYQRPRQLAFSLGSIAKTREQDRMNGIHDEWLPANISDDEIRCILKKKIISNMTINVQSI